MKKLLSLLVAAGMLFGSSVGAFATDIKVKGRFDFGFGLYDGGTFFEQDSSEPFDALQRFRTQIDFIASESLKGVAAFEIGDIYWGQGGGASWGNGSDAGSGSGGAMGADGVNVEVRRIYIDWLVPQTELQVRMGIQGFAMPQAVTRGDGEDGNYILDDDLAGILLSYNFNENFGSNFGWFRPWDGNLRNTKYTNSFIESESADKVDIFVLTLPIEFKNEFNFTPYATYALIGKNAEVIEGTGNIAPSLSSNSVFGDDGKAWWAGFAFNLNYLDPFIAAFDFTYGSYTADDHAAIGVDSPDRDGWVAVAKFGYKLDYFTPALFGWYGSGSDNVADNGLDGLMPYLSPYWGLTSFGWTNAHFGGREYLIGTTPAGTWAIGVGLEDIKFIERLTSQLRVMYFRGTNDLDSLSDVVNPPNLLNYYGVGLLGKDDSGIEVNLDNVINIYDNLDMFVELAYIHLNLDQADRYMDATDDAWKGYVGFTYSF